MLARAAGRARWGAAVRLAGLANAVAPGAASAATLTGTVSAAVVPPSVPAVITHDRHACGQRGLVYSATVSADAQGRVAQAVVYLAPRTPSDGAKLVRPKGRAARALVVDQRDCAFVPAVGALEVGGELRVRSSDPVFHNAHVRRADGTTAASVSTAIGGVEAVALVAREPGPLTLSCDAGHLWMHADVWVVEHGFFDSTRAHGRFRLEGVPPGAWWVVAWHPRLGEARVAVDVGPADRARSVAVVLPPRSASSEAPAPR